MAFSLALSLDPGVSGTPAFSAQQLFMPGKAGLHLVPQAGDGRFTGLNGSSQEAAPAPGSGVTGLILDRSLIGPQPLSAVLAQRAQLAPPLVAQQWTQFGPNVQLTDGLMTISGFSGIRRSLPAADGAWFQIAVRVRGGVSQSGSYMRLNGDGGDNANQTIILPEGVPAAGAVYSGYFRAYGPSAEFQIGGGSQTAALEIEDISIKLVPGLHLQALSDAARPALELDESLSFDTTDDALVASFPSGTLSDNMTVLMVVTVSPGTNGVLLTNHLGSGSVYTGAYDLGNMSTSPFSVVIGPSPQIAVNGVSTPTRGDLHAALTAGGTPKLVRMSQHDFSSWTGIGFNRYPSWLHGGSLHEVMMFEGADAALLQQAEQDLIARHGITL